MSEGGVPEVNADPAFQERFWVTVRFCWILMAGMVLAAIAGFTGSGGQFSSQTLEAGRSSVELPAISRWAASDTMTVSVTPQSPTTAVTVPAEFGDLYTIEAVNPAPVTVTSVAIGEKYVFVLSSARKVTIDFAIRATKPAWRKRLGRFSIDEHVSPAATVTVLP